jgi:hypothetical protein
MRLMFAGMIPAVMFPGAQAIYHIAKDALSAVAYKVSGRCTR